ncbi:anti-sigma factor family protein [candidate division KSB1 bacterium]
MYCLKDENFQQLLDKELSDTDKKQYEDHLSECSACRNKMTEMQDKTEFVKFNLDYLNPEHLPALSRESLLHAAKSIINTRKPKYYKWAWMSAAAVVLFFLLTINDSDNIIEIIDRSQIDAVVQSQEDIISADAVSWFSDRSFVISIVDKESNTVEHIITSNKKETPISVTTPIPKADAK